MQGRDIAFEPAKLLWLIQRDFLRKIVIWLARIFFCSVVAWDSLWTNKSFFQKLIIICYPFIYFLLLVQNTVESCWYAACISPDEIDIYSTFLQKVNLFKKWWMKLFDVYLIMMVSFSYACIFRQYELNLWWDVNTTWINCGCFLWRQETKILIRYFSVPSFIITKTF